MAQASSIRRLHAAANNVDTTVDAKPEPVKFPNCWGIRKPDVPCARRCSTSRPLWQWQPVRRRFGSHEGRDAAPALMSTMHAHGRLRWIAAALSRALAARDRAARGVACGCGPLAGAAGPNRRRRASATRAAGNSSLSLLWAGKLRAIGGANAALVGPRQPPYFCEFRAGTASREGAVFIQFGRRRDGRAGLLLRPASIFPE